MLAAEEAERELDALNMLEPVQPGPVCAGVSGSDGDLDQDTKSEDHSGCHDSMEKVPCYDLETIYDF